MLESIGAFMAWMVQATVWIVYAIWVLLICDSGQIVRLLPAWIAWLLSVQG
jgi:hypothetical protein